MYHSALNTIVYATTWTPIALLKINLGAHSVETIARDSLPWHYAEDAGLAINSVGQLYAIGEGGGLFHINKATGEGNFIGETGIGVQTFGADFLGDELIVALSDLGVGTRFFSVDTQTANATEFLHLPGVQLHSFTIASPDSLFFVNNRGADRILSVLNPYSRTVHEIGPTHSSHLDFGPDGNLYGARLSENVLVRVNPYTGAETPLMNIEVEGGTTLNEWSGLAVAPVREKPLLEFVSVASGAEYMVAALAVGARTYTDRSYTITSYSPELDNSLLLRTANADKRQDTSEFLTLRLNEGANIYVAYDQRGARTPPDWLDDGSWARTGLNMSSSDSGASPMVVFSKRVAPGYITLGSNHDGGDTGARSNYFLLVK